MQLISEINKGRRLLLSPNNTYSKYAWFVPLKDKKHDTITKEFQKKQQQQTK